MQQFRQLSKEASGGGQEGLHQIRKLAVLNYAGGCRGMNFDYGNLDYDSHNAKPLSASLAAWHVSQRPFLGGAAHGIALPGNGPD